MDNPSLRRHPLDRRRAPREAATDLAARRARETAEAEVAGYIAQMTAEMMAMASRANLDLLSYLLSIARTEAETIAHRSRQIPIVD